MCASEAHRTRVLCVRDDKGRTSLRRLDVAQDTLSILIDRRRLLAGAAGLAAFAGGPGPALANQAGGGASAFDPSPGPADAWIGDYDRQVVIRWGDPLWSETEAPSPVEMTADQAARRFGYNNDYLAYFPLPDTSGADEAGLLVVNHEYPSLHMMFPGVTADQGHSGLSDDQIAATLSAVGVTVVEVRRQGEIWRPQIDSRYARRVTACTPIRLSGPAAGHPRLRTESDPSGRWVLGTHDNCNGGMTPWGTFLSGEEGSRDFFGGDIRGLADEGLLARYHYDESVELGAFGWPRVDPRFDLRQAPNEPNRFEWVVELDPFDPEAPPVKRTALGRFAHEGAHCSVAPDGRVVVYMGDDWEFEYLYRFVTRDPFDPQDRAINRDLLDHGVLSVARFDAKGGLDWMPLVFGQGPLTPANGFADQGDLLIQTRRAADLLGATPMDCPEGYQADPRTGRVYVALSGNDARTKNRRDAANPRANNAYGHMLELTPPDDGAGPNPTADRFEWRVLVLCGPHDGSNDTFDPAVAPQDRFFAPDNFNFDPQGRMWMCSDGPGDRGEDGLWVMAMEGEDAGRPRLVYRPPIGAECCGPAFTPDGTTLFMSIQHPGEIAVSLDKAPTRWPDGRAEVPKPSVIALRQKA
jgi:secreted PhoX family phosphatase